MTVIITRVGKRGAIKGVKKVDFEDAVDKYGIKPGQVYLSADGASNGVVVVSTSVNEVLVTPISPAGVSGPDQKMDAKEMSQVDFYLVEPPYITWTKPVMKKYLEDVKAKAAKGKKS